MILDITFILLSNHPRREQDVGFLIRTTAEVAECIHLQYLKKIRGRWGGMVVITASMFLLPNVHKSAAAQGLRKHLALCRSVNSLHAPQRPAFRQDQELSSEPAQTWVLSWLVGPTAVWAAALSLDSRTWVAGAD